MDDVRYTSICSEYDLFVDWGLTISDALFNKDAPQDREFYGDRIFGKFLGHAITLRKIMPTGLKPIAKNGVELWDLSSACALTRALIETFDALFYISIEEVDEEEREFRMLLWNLHSEERRLKKLELINSSSSEVAKIADLAVDLRGRVLTHNFFDHIGDRNKGKIKKGDSPAFYLTQKERNTRAQIDHNYYTSSTMFLSAYVHTFPFAINQLMQFKAGDRDSLGMMSMPMQYSLGFFANSIDGMHAIFGDRLPQKSQEIANQCEVWHGILRDGM